MKQKKVAVQACEAIDRDSFKVPEIIDGGKDQYEISSVNFLKMVYKLAGWKDDGTYRIAGVVFAENRLVEFELGDAVKIADEEFVDPEVEQ